VFRETPSGTVLMINKIRAFELSSRRYAVT